MVRPRSTGRIRRRSRAPDVAIAPSSPCPVRVGQPPRGRAPRRGSSVRRLSGPAADLDQVLSGARALLGGQDPYGQAERARFFYPQFYPLTALLLLVPLAPL